MKKVVTFFLMSLGLITNIYSQSSNISLKFKKYIPEKYSGSFIYMQNLDSKITEIAKTDPKLIYPYLLSLGFQWTANEKAGHTDYANYYGYVKYVTMKNRDEWLRKNYNSYPFSSHSLPLRRKAYSIYPDYQETEIINNKNVPLPVIDSNEVYYFAQLFFSDSVNQTMQKGINYKEVYTGLLKNRISGIENRFKNVKPVTKESIKAFCSENLQFWYLFDNNYLADYNISNNIPYKEMLFDTYINLYKEHFAISLGAGVMAVSKNYTDKRTYNYIMYDIPYPYTMEYKFKNTFFADVRINIPIKREIAPFSHIEVGVSYLKGQYSSSNNKTLFSYTGSSQLKYITKSCAVSDSSIKFNSFAADMLIPAYYFNPDLYILVGGEMLYTKWSAKPKMVYTEETTYLVPERKEYKLSVVPLDFSKAQTQILPVIEAHYCFWNNFELMLRFDLELKAGLRYIFKI